MNSTKATYAAIRKALATLDDPFTRFLEPAQYAALRRGTAGSLTGVGLEVGFDTTPSGSGNSLVVTFTYRSFGACLFFNLMYLEH